MSTRDDNQAPFDWTPPIEYKRNNTAPVAASLNLDDERAAFEAWIGLNSRIGPKAYWHDDAYSSNYVNEMWECWQAARRVPAYASADGLPPLAKPIARLLHWKAPKHMPVPFRGVCARTFGEFKENAGVDGYWKEGEPLYTAEQVRQAQRDAVAIVQAALDAAAALAADTINARNEEITELRAQLIAADRRTRKDSGDCD